MLLSAFLDALYQKVLRLSKKQYWFLALVGIFAIVTFINGAAIVPERLYQRLSENPFITRKDIDSQNYFQETLLLPIVAYYLRLTSRATFNLLCLLIIVIGYAFFVFQTFKRQGALPSLIFSTLLITSPLTTILLTWIGMPDGLIMGLTVPLLFTSSSALVFIITVLGTTNHIVFFVAAVELLFLRWLIWQDKIKIHHLLFAITGGLTGLALVKWFIQVNQIEVVSRIDFMQMKGVEYWINQNLENLPTSIASLFNLHWVILLLCLVMFYKWDKRFFIAAFIILFVNYGVAFFSLDTTRVFSLLSWGIFMTILFHSYELSQSHPESSPKHRDQFIQALILIGIASIFAPRYFYWAGEIHTTPFYELMRRLFS